MIIKSAKSDGFEIETAGLTIIFIRVPGLFEMHRPDDGERVWSDLRRRVLR